MEQLASALTTPAGQDGPAETSTTSTASADSQNADDGTSVDPASASCASWPELSGVTDCIDVDAHVALSIVDLEDVAVARSGRGHTIDPMPAVGEWPSC